eukprot:gene1344-2594_t
MNYQNDIGGHLKASRGVSHLTVNASALADESTSEVDDGSKFSDRETPNLKDETAIVGIERDIFLKAILQLLDQRDTNIEASRSFKRLNSGFIKSDIIKAGSLRKASGSSIFLWKEKFVELRHGVFTYEDDIGWGDGHKKKSIVLAIDQCRCKPIESGSSQGHWLFELSVVNGRQRLWMCASSNERDSWVQAINTAILGSAGDFNPDDDNNDNDHMKDPRDEGIKEFSKGSKLLATPHFKQKGGGTAPYVTEIERYNNIKSTISQVITVRDYQKQIADLYAKKLTVPVFYVKEICGVDDSPSRQLPTPKRATAMSSSERRASAANKRALLSAQVWKDLPRDVISVNGEVISGFRGAEAMVGAIVRSVLRQADIIRAEMMKRHEDSRFDLNEGDALSCVRDVLMACNRTESGGDSYLCVNSLLSNRDLVVVTPYDTQAEPMQISIDIVDSGKRFRRDEKRNGNGNGSGNEEELRFSSSIRTCGSIDLGEDISCDFDSTSEINGTEDNKPGSVMSPSGSNGTLVSMDISQSADNQDDMKSSTKRPSTIVADLDSYAIGELLESPPTDEIMLSPKAPHNNHNRNLSYGDNRNRNNSNNIRPPDASPLLKHSNTAGTGTGATGTGVVYSGHGHGDNDNMERNGDRNNAADTAAGRERSKSGPEAFSGNFINQKSGGSNGRQRSGSEAFPAYLVPLSDTSKTSYFTRLRSSLFRKKHKPLPEPPGMSESPPLSPPCETRGTSKSFFLNMLRSPLAGVGVGVGGGGGGSSTASTSAPPAHTPSETTATADKEESVAVSASISMPQSTCSSPATSIRRSSRTDQHQHQQRESRIFFRRRSKPHVTVDDVKKGEVPSSSQTLFTATPTMCIRIQVRVKSRYRICAADPQDETEDTWASVTGCLHQLFFIKSNSNGRPAISDRLVTVTIGQLSQNFLNEQLFPKSDSPALSSSAASANMNAVVDFTSPMPSPMSLGSSYTGKNKFL